MQAKQKDNFILTMNLIGSGTFGFEIAGDVLLLCSKIEYYLTELYCLSNISPSIEAAHKLADLSFVFTKYIFYLLI